MTVEARQAAETAARVSYGRLVALLSSRSRDIAAAEDALSEAFAAALRVWPDKGVPKRPEAWLLTAARRVLGHDHRSRAVREAASASVERIYEEMAVREPAEFPDERLKLLFVCAHPAIDESVRTPLMLQVVLGLDASRIGAAFLTPASTMGQRLVRAKVKIRDAGLRFEAPDRDVMAARLGDVLSAIYAAYGTGWDAVQEAGAGAGERATGLAAEAIYLGRLVVGLLPREPEPKGLLSMMLHCESRRAARRGSDGRFVPLALQDPRLWSRDEIVEAEGWLVEAARAGRFGRFQTEAAIQSLHCHRVLGAPVSAKALMRLYDLLAEEVQTVGVLVARAAAYGEGAGPEIALEMLDAIAPECAWTYQPFWVVRAWALRLKGSSTEADAALDTALSMTDDPAVWRYLEETRGHLSPSSAADRAGRADASSD